MEVGSYRELTERNGPFAHYLNRCLTQADEQQGGEGQADQEGNTGILGMVGEGEGGRLQIDPNDEREERGKTDQEGNTGILGMVGEGEGGRLQIDPNDEREERERLTRKVTQVSWGWWGRGGGEFTDTQMTRGAD